MPVDPKICHLKSNEVFDRAPSWCQPRIPKKSGLNRVTNYEVLKRLEKTGAVGAYKRRGSKHFLAVDPRILLQRAKERITKMEEMLPQMVALSNHLEKKPKIYFFEGLEGIKNIYQDSLQSGQEILTFTNPMDLEKVMGDFEQKYYEERLKRKINVKGIVANSAKGREAKLSGKNLLRQVRLFEDHRYFVSNEVMIYGDKMAIYSNKDQIGIVVQSKQMVETIRNIWQMVWDSLPE
jgi:sugar-specific transcriptional regulator TrmB